MRVLGIKWQRKEYSRLADVKKDFDANVEKMSILSAQGCIVSPPGINMVIWVKAGVSVVGAKKVEKDLIDNPDSPQKNESASIQLSFTLFIRLLHSIS